MKSGNINTRNTEKDITVDLNTTSYVNLNKHACDSTT